MLALVTATRNSIITLSRALLSVEGVCDRIKLFFVDGGSTDGTVEVLRAFIEGGANALFIRQDGLGLYQALNQGVQAAIKDPDVNHIGILHSDDQVIPVPFERYLSLIENNPADVFYSGIEFHNRFGVRVRKWNSGRFSRFKLNTGWMPPHTSVIVTKRVYLDVGQYDPNFGTAADYEWIVRVLRKCTGKVQYFPERTVTMLIGGASSANLRSRLRANAMDGKVWVRRSWLHSIIIRFCKPVRKISQFLFVK